MVANLYHSLNPVDHCSIGCFIVSLKRNQVRIWGAGFLDLSLENIDVLYRVGQLGPASSEGQASQLPPP